MTASFSMVLTSPVSLTSSLIPRPLAFFFALSIISRTLARRSLHGASFTAFSPSIKEAGGYPSHGVMQRTVRFSCINRNPNQLFCRCIPDPLATREPRYYPPFQFVPHDKCHAMRFCQVNSPCLLYTSDAADE